jgi:RhtB (resistance to homoserine/threonine) family protein
MLSADTSMAFFTLSLILGFTPGPDNLFLLMQSATQGRRAGTFVMLGLCVGLVVHTTAVALGLAAIFAASATAFAVLKFSGAAYLTYLAWQAFRAPASEIAEQKIRQTDMWRMFLRGVLMNLTNPKVIFFFLALLPQFVQPELGSIAFQLFSLGLIIILATLVAFGSIVYFAAAVSDRLKRAPKAQRWLNFLAGTVFLGMAARLAMSKR